MGLGMGLFATDTYEDITPQLKAAAESMEQGSIALAHGMHLHDALSAFQIGYEKVDTGNPVNFKTLKEELMNAESKFPIFNNEKNLIQFMDALSCAEMAWHAGYSPVQTVTTCLAVESQLQLLQTDPYSIITEGADDIRFIGQTFVLSVITTIAQAIELSNMSAVIFPEEDLHTTRPWMYLLDRIGGTQFVTEKLDKCAKLAKASGKLELLERINIRRTWMNVLKQRIPKKVVHLDALEQGINNVFTEDATSNDVNVWFTAGCQSRLDMECLKLDLKQFSNLEAKKLWLEIIGGIRHCVSVFQLQRSVDLLGFFLQFSIRQDPAIVRAMLERECLRQDTILGVPLKQWVFRDICETSPPFDMVKNKDFDIFLSQAGLCYYDLLTMFCRNRCRLRDGLSSLFGAFESLQFSTVLSEENKVSTLFASWLFFRKLQIMMWIVLLSFETDVVSYREQGYTNWYGFKVAQQLLTHLGRMRQLFEVHGGGARESPGYGFLAALELESQVLSQLLAAEYLLYLALHKGVSPPSKMAENGPTEDMLFNLRFQVFSDGPTLKEYKMEFDALDVETALKGSASASRSATGLLKTLGPLAANNPEIPKLKRSAIGLSVAVTQIIRGYTYASAQDTEGYHSYFPIPKLKAT